MLPIDGIIKGFNSVVSGIKEKGFVGFIEDMTMKIKDSIMEIFASIKDVILGGVSSLVDGFKGAGFFKIFSNNKEDDVENKVENVKSSITKKVNQPVLTKPPFSVNMDGVTYTDPTLYMSAIRDKQEKEKSVSGGTVVDSSDKSSTTNIYPMSKPALAQGSI